MGKRSRVSGALRRKNKVDGGANVRREFRNYHNKNVRLGGWYRELRTRDNGPVFDVNLTSVEADGIDQSKSAPKLRRRSTVMPAWSFFSNHRETALTLSCFANDAVLATDVWYLVAQEDGRAGG